MALPKNIKAILFDCDNTLVMSEPRAFDGCADVINDICKKKEVPIEKPFTGPTLLSRFVGMNFRGMMHDLQGKYKFDLPPEEEEDFVLKEMYKVMDKIREDLDICEGVDEQLRALQALNKPEFDKRQAGLKAINDELEVEKAANEKKIDEWKEAVKKYKEEVEKWEKKSDDEKKNSPVPTEPIKPEWEVMKKEKLDELQKELDAFKTGVDGSNLLFELRKEENWKLETLHKFNTQLAAYEHQEAVKKQKEDAKKAAEAAGKQYISDDPKDKIKPAYREKEVVRPTSLEASTPLLLIVVSSSAKARVEASVEKGKMLEYFGTRIFSAATSLPKPTSKPNPAIYEFAMKQFGVKPEECIAVEDSVSGATAGRSADIPTIGYVWPYTQEEGGDKSDEMAEKLQNLTKYGTDPPVKTGCNVIMRNWSEFPKLLKELDDAAEKPKASI